MPPSWRWHSLHFAVAPISRLGSPGAVAVALLLVLPKPSTALPSMAVMEKSTTGGLAIATRPIVTFGASAAKVVAGVLAVIVMGEVPVGTGTGGVPLPVAGGGVVSGGASPPPPPQAASRRAVTAVIVARPERIELVFMGPPSLLRWTRAMDNYLFATVDISCGPGPSGSLCAMPKWQSMHVLPSARPFAWRACAFADCRSLLIPSRLWQLRHSRESVAFICTQTCF